MAASFRKNVAIAFTVALFFVAALGALQYQNAHRLNAENQWAAHTQMALRVIGSVRTRLERADASAQSFVITGNPSYLDAYNQATSDLLQQVETLRQLTSDNPSQQQRVGELRSLLVGTLGSIQKEIEARGADTTRAEALLPLESSIRQSTADANAMVDQIANQEEDLLNQRNAAAQQSDHRANLLILFSTLTAFIIIAAAGIALLLDVIHRTEAERSRVHALEGLQVANQKLEGEVSERAQAQEKLRESEASLRDLSVRLLRSQDEERRRIGRELHDSVGQQLAALKLALGSLQNHLARQFSSTLTDCMELADHCIKEVRTLSYLLHPPMLEEMGLREVVPWYVDGFSKRSGIQTTVDMPQDFFRLPSDAELVIVRVLQESLTNVHRHSCSPTAQVRVVLQDNSVTLEVQDQGKGLPFPVSSNGSLADRPGPWGVGLQGMSERVKNQGGKLRIETGDSGTTIRVTLPVTPVHASKF